MLTDPDASKDCNLSRVRSIVAKAVAEESLSLSDKLVVSPELSEEQVLSLVVVLMLTANNSSGIKLYNISLPATLLQPSSCSASELDELVGSYLPSSLPESSSQRRKVMRGQHATQVTKHLHYPGIFPSLHGYICRVNYGHGMFLFCS